MLTKIATTALRFLLIASLAVFFSGPVRADESSLADIENGFADLIYRLSRSVVTVESTRPVSSGLAGLPHGETVQSLISSGVIYDTLGHIIVEASSVTGVEGLHVRFENHLLAARLIGIDYQSGLALIDVGRRIGIPAELVDQYGCVGRMVIVIGNSFGLQASPSIGFCAGSRPDGNIQFSGALTSGLVGGGLFDLSGRLTGIVASNTGENDARTIGLAVPAHRLPSIVEFLVDNGSRQAGWVGITTTDIEISPGIDINPPILFASRTSNRMNVIDRALHVDRVVSSSPAETAGLRPGDLIYAIDGRRLYSATDLMSMVLKSGPGTKFSVSLVRQNDLLNLPLTIGRRQLASPVQPVGSIGGESISPAEADSLMRGIRTLRQMIDRLEYRLNSLK